MKPSDTRKKMIAKIKIGQKELAMAEQDYRAMLLRVTGKSSCALLSVAELDGCCASWGGWALRRPALLDGGRCI